MSEPIHLHDQLWALADRWGDAADHDGSAKGAVLRQCADDLIGLLGPRAFAAESAPPVHIEITEQSTLPVVPPDNRPKLEPPMTISIVEQAHQDDIRTRSIQLARERGHLRS